MEPDKLKEIGLARQKARQIYRQILGPIFLILGLVLFGMGVVRITAAWKTSKWPTTEGYITHSTVHIFHSSKDTEYSYDIKYEYKVAANNYVSDKVQWTNDEFPFSYFAEKIVDRYPVGKKVTVFYSPDMPSLAVLETGVHGTEYFTTIVGLAFISLGLWLCKTGFIQKNLPPFNMY
jgi:hypothetical protein